MSGSQQAPTNWGWLIVAGVSVLILGASAVPFLLWVTPAIPTMLAGMAFAVVGGVLASSFPKACGRVAIVEVRTHIHQPSSNGVPRLFVKERRL